jgi:Leucine-rich repeat (LRR) protein
MFSRLWFLLCLSSSVILEQNFQCDQIKISSMEYMTMTRNNSVEHKTDKIVTTTTDTKTITVISTGHNRVLCNKMFEAFFNVDSLGIFATSVVEIETKFLQGQNLDDGLYINQGKIKTIRKQTFVDLPIRELRLTANKIATIEEQAFVNLSRLERISLGQNQLTQLDPRSFVGLPNLRDFYASTNKITQLQKNIFQFMKTKNISIDLGFNRIETVNREVFGELAAEVVDIDLHLNKLSFLPTDVFKGRRFLKIDLSQNDISHISPEFFDDLQVQHLDLSFNRLDNKSLDLLEAWATETNVSLEYFQRTSQRSCGSCFKSVHFHILFVLIIKAFLIVFVFD